MSILYVIFLWLRAWFTLVNTRMISIVIKFKNTAADFYFSIENYHHFPGRQTNNYFFDFLDTDILFFYPTGKKAGMLWCYVTQTFVQKTQKRISGYYRMMKILTIAANNNEYQSKSVQ